MPLDMMVMTERQFEDLADREMAEKEQLYHAYRSGDPVRIQDALLTIGDEVDCLHDEDTCPRGCRCLCVLCDNN